MINHLVGRILYDNVYIGKQILGFYPYIVFIIIYCGSYAAMVRTFIMIIVITAQLHFLYQQGFSQIWKSQIIKTSIVS